MFLFLTGGEKMFLFLTGEREEKKKTPSKKREKIVFFIFKSEKKNRKTGNKAKTHGRRSLSLSLSHVVMMNDGADSGGK